MEDNIINFTSKNIENLPTPQLGKRFFYRDVKTNGLMLMVTPSGCKSFKVTRKKNGKLIRVTLGKYPDISIENARKAAAEVNYKISQGTNPNHEKNKIRNEITFGEMFNDYMEKYSKKHKKSWNEDKRNIERFCTKLIAKKASDISIKELQTLHIQIGDNNGEYQANRVLEKIRSIYNKNIQWGWEGKNPTIGIKKFKEKSRERFLQPEEMPRFIKSVMEEDNRIFRQKELNELIKVAAAEIQEKEKLISAFNDPKFRELDTSIKTNVKKLEALNLSKQNYDKLISSVSEISNEFKPIDKKEDVTKNDFDKLYNELISNLDKTFKELKSSKNVKLYADAESQITAIKTLITTQRQSLKDFLKDKGIISENQIDNIAQSREEISRLEAEKEANLKELIKLQEAIKNYNLNSFNITSKELQKLVDASIKPITDRLTFTEEKFKKQIETITFKQSFDEDKSKQLLCDRFCRIFNERVIKQDTEKKLESGKVLQVIFDKLTKEELLISSQKDFLKKITEVRGIGGKFWSIFNELMNDEEYFLIFNLLANQFLLDTKTYRRIDVEYGNRPLEKRSFGQKCTAVLIILLLLGDKPVILDEPEAHLDNKLISDYLVELIKQQKEHRQIIFATHNANFVINGDAELIHILDIGNDNTTEIISTTIENLETRSKLLALEGGKDAFEKRERKYELQ